MSFFVRRIAVVAAIALTQVSSISTRSISRTAARYSHIASCKSYSTSCARLRPLQSRRPDDFIEAEIVSSKDSTSISRSQGNEKIEILGAEKSNKRQEQEEESGGIFNRLATFFGQDEESKLRKERKKKLNTAIDKVFEGSGALGTVFGSLAKGIGGMVAESLYAANADLGVIQSSVLNKLEADAECVSELGGQIDLSQPQISTSSSTSINGNTKKEYYYVMGASGNRGQGTLQVWASVEGKNKVDVTKLIMTTQTGRKIDIGTGGGGRGGSGRVIDVEARVN